MPSDGASMNASCFKIPIIGYEILEERARFTLSALFESEVSHCHNLFCSFHTHKHRFELAKTYFCLHDLPMDTDIKTVSSTFVFSQLLVAYMSAAVILLLFGCYRVHTWFSTFSGKFQCFWTVIRMLWLALNYYYYCYHHHHHHHYTIWMSLVTGLFCLVLLLNQRWSPPLTLEVLHCSTFRIMCDVPSIAVFCGESIECFPGTASKFLLRHLITLSVAPIFTGIIVHFMLHGLYL